MKINVNWYLFFIFFLISNFNIIIWNLKQAWYFLETMKMIRLNAINFSQAIKLSFNEIFNSKENAAIV